MRARICIVAALGLAVTLALSALEWPTDLPGRSSTFGTWNRGRFSVGLSLASQDGFARTAASGDVAIAFDGAYLPGGFPSTLGSFVVAVHAQDLSTVYGRLMPGSVSGYLKALRERDILGKSGGSGYGPDDAAWFAVYDRAQDQYVNPFILLAEANDKKPPLIRSAQVVNADRSYKLGEARSIRQGTYEILVDVSDPEEGAAARAPFSIRFLVDGIERFACRYDAAKASDGRLRFFPGTPRDRTEYFDASGRIRLGSHAFARGAASITIQTADYAGNARESTWPIIVE